jgi:hypothetical protein
MFSMEPNWDNVKKSTLWNYDDLIKKLILLESYPTLWQAYNHDMTQAAAFAHHLFADGNIQAEDYPVQLLSTIEYLRSAGVRSWGDLLAKVRSREECIVFLTQHNLNFEQFINLLNYLLRWAFPFETASRELLEHESPQEMVYYGILKQNKLMNSFEILEMGHTFKGRHAILELTGLPLNFVINLTHRADIARLPYARRKTILPLCGAGYDTLAKIARADLDKLEADLETYFSRLQGKSWKNYRSVIVLKILVTSARALPVIME